MRFWDASALVPLLVPEAGSSTRAAQLRADSHVAVWWGTLVEGESALQRRVRDGTLTPELARSARTRLAEISSHWHEVPPSPALRTLAVRLLRTHPLRAADALQLAAALSLGAALRRQLGFVCADDRLAAAAETEGLPVIR